MDVGQGDGILIQSPSGQNVVYDAGENPSRMRDYLAGLGVSAVGLVIGSHNHTDHIGGLPEVLRFFRPPFYMDSGVPATTQTYKRVLEAVGEAGSQLLEPTARRIQLGEASLSVVPPSGILHWDQNDNSIGILVEYGYFRLSLAGDAEPREWAQWLRLHRDLFARVQIHKSSHHGSSQGDTAEGMDLLSPDVVVISVGRGNGYGHPDPEAVGLYAGRGATVYRTDLNGTIIVDAQASGAYTVRVERGEGARAHSPMPSVSIPALAPNPPMLPPSQSPDSSPAPPLARSPFTGSWTGPLPPRSPGRHPLCHSRLPSVACVNDMSGPAQAICSDRSLSCSAGSGTCSGHGGVYCWRN